MSDQAFPVAGITVVDRHRRDLGDLNGLARSIREVGLLHPIVVTADGRLVAGQRRLEAVRSLGWDEVPVTVVTALDDARLALLAERDENVCRKDMTPSEKVALGRALEELERPRAEERMTLGKISPGSRGERTGKVYDLVGEAVGMSGPTYKRAKAVTHMAEHGETLPYGNATRGKPLTPAQQKVARQARDNMDATGKVTPAYEHAMAPIRAGDPEPRINETAINTKTYKGRAPLEGTRRVIYAVHGAALPLKDLDPAEAAPDAEEADRWLADLSAAASAIRKFRARLKEYSDG